MLNENSTKKTMGSNHHDEKSALLSRAQGCLLGQLAGDALGSLVEFQSSEEIRQKYPEGVRDLSDGGTWKTIAGQPTDDSEMALLLARMLVNLGRYDVEEARKVYIFWLHSRPFDCGKTISASLQGVLKSESQANGAMMRISPLGIFGANHDLAEIAEWARQDAGITHPNVLCLQANALFAMAIAHGVRTGCRPDALYGKIVEWAEEMRVESNLLAVIKGAVDSPPEDYLYQAGWVLTAFKNVLWQLLHAPTLQEGVVDTVKRGGDTDTNGAICGALLGAVYGREAIPLRWIDTLLQCRPAGGVPGVRRPRPECFWPVDALELAEALIRQ